MLCRLVWTYTSSSPIFSTPAVDRATSTIFVSAVTGTITALTHLGQPQWQCHLGSQVFAPLCLLPASSSAAGSVTVAAAAAAADMPRGAVPSLDWGVSTQGRMTKPDSDAEAGSASGSAITSFLAAKTAPVSVAAARCELAAALDLSNSIASTGISSNSTVGTDDVKGAVMLVVGTAAGTLHCISCSSGEQLWGMDTDSSISTASGVCPVSMSAAPADALAAAKTAAGGDSSGHTSAAIATKLLTHEHTESCSTEQSSVQPQTGSLMMPESRLKITGVSCTNQGAVRVLNLPDLSSVHEEDVANPGQQAARRTVGEDEQGSRPRVAAGTQMPGKCQLLAA